MHIAAWHPILQRVCGNKRCLCLYHVMTVCSTKTPSSAPVPVSKSAEALNRPQGPVESIWVTQSVQHPGVVVVPRKFPQQINRHGKVKAKYSPMY